MKKSLKILIAVFLGIFLSNILFLYFFATRPVTLKDSSKFQQTLTLIRDKYVDDINIDSLLDAISPEIIAHLDPHSEYIPLKKMKGINEQITGHFDGIGVVFNMATDTATVLSTVTSGPGYKAGVQPGDRIITVNDTVIAGVKMNQDSVVNKLRGKRGTEVVLGIKRGNNKELMDFTLVRDVIPINSVEAKFITQNKGAYIRINSFAQNTYTDVVNSLDEMIKNGATSAVIDLRRNGGGLLDQAILLANEFLEKDQVIVYIEGEHVDKIEQPAYGNGAFKTIPLYVLIDESSASASEIFAGAMQDNDRATIIGRRSFGKGLVQEQIPYDDGSAIRLTIARYYTPLGRPVQKPYVYGDTEKYNMEVYERYENNEVSTGQNNAVDSTQEYRTPKGRILYGGGGISPDIFVPIDTTEIPKYFLEVFYKNSTFLFARDFSDQYRKEINAIENFKQLNQFINSHPNLYDMLIEYAAKHHGVKRPDAKAKQEARDVVTAQIKGFIGRNTKLQESAFYYYMQEQDEVLKKLNEILQNR